MLQPSVVCSPAAATAAEQKKVKSVHIYPLAAHHRPAVGPVSAPLSLCVRERVCLFASVCVCALCGQHRPQTRAALADLMRRAGLPWLGQALSFSHTHRSTCPSDSPRSCHSPPKSHTLVETHTALLESHGEKI